MYLTLLSVETLTMVYQRSTEENKGGFYCCIVWLKDPDVAESNDPIRTDVCKNI